MQNNLPEEELLVLHPLKMDTLLEEIKDIPEKVREKIGEWMSKKKENSFIDSGKHVLVVDQWFDQVTQQIKEFTSKCPKREKPFDKLNQFFFNFFLQMVKDLI